MELFIQYLAIIVISSIVLVPLTVLALSFLGYLPKPDWISTIKEEFNTRPIQDDYKIESDWQVFLSEDFQNISDERTFVDSSSLIIVSGVFLPTGIQKELDERTLINSSFWLPESNSMTWHRDTTLGETEFKTPRITAPIQSIKSADQTTFLCLDHNLDEKNYQDLQVFNTNAEPLVRSKQHYIPTGSLPLVVSLILLASRNLSTNIHPTKTYA